MKTLKNLLVKGSLIGALTLTGCYEGSFSDEEEGTTMAELETAVGALLMQSDDPDDVKLGTFLYTLGAQAHEREVAREGRDQININIPPAIQPTVQKLPENVIYSDGTYRPAPGYTWVDPKGADDFRVKRKITAPEAETRFSGGLFSYNRWVDLNNSGTVDGNELFGLGKKVFNPAKEPMTIGFYAPDKKGAAIFRVWTETGDLLGTDSWSYNGEIRSYFTIPGVPLSDKNTMGKLKKAGPGDYVMTVNFENESDVYFTKIKIVR